MKKQADRKVSSLNRFFRKAYWRLSIYKPSYTLFGLISIGVAIFLLGGGVYDILLAKDPTRVLENPQFVYLYWIFYPRLDKELLSGSIIVMVLYTLGTLGLLMAYQSSKYARNPRHATILLLIGVAFTLVAFALIESVIYNYKM